MATIVAAVLAFGGVAYQQHRHWKETQRDKVRAAYAEWMSALARSRRTEERFLLFAVSLQSEMRRRANFGDPIARTGGLAIDEATRGQKWMIEQEIETGRLEIDVAFSKVCLLDRDWRRIKAAEAVHGMPTCVAIQEGERISEQAFNDRWVEKSKALGLLADLINRTLALEDVCEFQWESFERALDERQAKLHKHVQSDRRGKPT